MRHRIYGKHLGRDKDQRSALFKNLVQSLLIHGSIQTTEVKAKSIKGLVDKVINQVKKKNLNGLVARFVTQKEVKEKLVEQIAPSLKDRSSGYTSIIRVGPRLGDGAMMVRMSLVLRQPASSNSQAAKRITTKGKKA